MESGEAGEKVGEAGVDTEGRREVVGAVVVVVGKGQGAVGGEEEEGSRVEEEQGWREVGEGDEVGEQRTASEREERRGAVGGRSCASTRRRRK